MKPERLTAIFFLSVIMTFMCLAPVSLAAWINDKSDIAERRIANQVINWQKLYPFEEREAARKTQSSVLTHTYLKAKLEDLVSSKRLIGSMRAVEAAKRYEDIIGWNIASAYEYNGVTKLHDGWLTAVVRNADVSETAASVIEFNEYCEREGIDFFYVNAPYKVCVSEDRDISGTLDFSNQNTDRFLERLEASGVRAYDLRKYLHADGMNHHAAFYRTDHHWRVETGLWAAKHILEFLRDDYGWNVKPEILNPENFEHIVYPEWFLGSQGKKFMLARTKPDDFTFIYPKYETNVRFEIPNMSLDKTGDFMVMCDMSKVVSKDYYHLSPYHAYIYGESALQKVTNMLADNEKTVLVIRDSFADAVIPFLALGLKNTQAIDLRHFNGSVKSYIKTNKPDLIIVMYNSETAGAVINQNRHDGHCDFR